MQLQVTKLNFSVSTSKRKAGIKLPKRLVSCTISGKWFAFSNEEKLVLDMGKIKIRPHRYRPITVSLKILVSMNKEAGEIMLGFDCSHDADKQITVQPVGYSLKAVKGNDAI